MTDMATDLGALLRQSLKMTPEEMAEFRAKAKAEAEAVEEGGLQPVSNSADFKRIKALPQREWNHYQQPEFVEAATQALKRPDGTMTLKPVQAAALIEFQRHLGMIGLIGTGKGKALLSFLLKQVLEGGPHVAVILVPPSLVEQSHRVFAAMNKHWVLDSGNTHIVSYSTLSSTTRGDILDKLKPTIIIPDEAAKLRNPKSARSIRVYRYLDLNPSCFFCPLSGTMTVKGLKDYQKLLKYAMRRAVQTGMPVPDFYPTLKEWGSAIDSNVKEELRRPPGVLRQFCQGEEEPTRVGFRRRLISTPGIVATGFDEEKLPPLVINCRPLELSAKVKAAISIMEETWTRPDGEEFSDILSLTKTVRELSCGFWYKWIWPGGEADLEWMKARSNWHKTVREKLKHPGPGMDSPLHLFNAADRGAWKTPHFEPWKAVKGRYGAEGPPTEAQWLDSSFMVNDALAWGRKEPGIIWYWYDAVGKEISKRGNFPLYYTSDQGGALLDEKGDRTIVVSMHSFREGQNLQHSFWRNLITTPTASGDMLEQIIARTHRDGQEEDEVIVDMYLHTDSYLAAFTQAHRDALYMQETLGNPQKVLAATKTFEGFDAVT